MKTIFSFTFSFLLLFLSAQDINTEIASLQSMIDSESYMQALGFADKLIANKVKEGHQEQASKVYLLRGIAKYKLELETDAIVDLKIAHSFDNSNYITYYYISDIYYNMSKYSSALESIIIESSWRSL